MSLERIERSYFRLYSRCGKNHRLLDIVNKFVIKILEFLEQLKLRYTLYVDRRFRARPRSKVFDCVEIVSFKYDAQGAFCISADLELCWAWRFVGSHYEKGKMCRRRFPYLMKTFDRYLIPVTWAVVGHLFLKSCRRNNNGLAHPNMPRPEGCSNTWYKDDPCTSVEEDPCWYAPDLISRIMQSNVKHEIAMHSFSHVDFSDSKCTPSVALHELEESIRLMKNYGVKPRSMVFPFGREGHLNLLSKTGVISYRGGDGIYTISYPKRREYELWEVHQSLYLKPSPLDNWSQKAKYSINKAVENNCVFHLWFHPSEIDQEMVRRNLIPILEYAHEKRAEGELWIATMGEIASYCEAREKSDLSVENRSEKLRIILHTNVDQQKIGYSEITLKINLKRSSPKVVIIDGKTIEMGTARCYMKKNTNIFLIITISSETKEVTIIKKRSNSGAP